MFYLPNFFSVHNNHSCKILFICISKSKAMYWQYKFLCFKSDNMPPVCGQKKLYNVLCSRLKQSCAFYFRLTSVYLACKVEEFNVSIMQFVGNLKGDREKFANIILGFELLLMDKLHYHLTVHNPFRPLEGFIIDLKV